MSNRWGVSAPVSSAPAELQCSHKPAAPALAPSQIPADHSPTLGLDRVLSHRERLPLDAVEVRGRTPQVSSQLIRRGFPQRKPPDSRHVLTCTVEQIEHRRGVVRVSASQRKLDADAQLRGACRVQCHLRPGKGQHHAVGCIHAGNHEHVQRSIQQCGMDAVLASLCGDPIGKHSTPIQRAALPPGFDQALERRAIAEPLRRQLRIEPQTSTGSAPAGAPLLKLRATVFGDTRILLARAIRWHDRSTAHHQAPRLNSCRAQRRERPCHPAPRRTTATARRLAASKLNGADSISSVTVQPPTA